MKNSIVRVVLFIIAFFVANFISQFVLGFVMGIGGNVKMIGISSVSFDPLITIAYLLLYYCLTQFYLLHPRQKYIIFLLTLALSFTLNFIQGSVLLTAFLFILNLLKLI